ncbi:MAG: hypothetical protein IJ856_00795 [Candidatus Methanomethylophilaceae archaeon]|nr:hypothetical protein [Candidatus Methanomethylophilaceae archaeon]
MKAWPIICSVIILTVLAATVVAEDSDALPKGASVSIGERDYSDIGAALAAASPGDTVKVWCPDYRSVIHVGGDVSVPKGVTLLLSFDGSDTDTVDADRADDSKYSRKVATDRAKYQTTTVQVDSKATLTVYGRIAVGSILSWPGNFDYQGHTSGAHATLTVNGSVVVADGGRLDAYGFVNGNGKVTASPGSIVSQPLIVTEYVGGDYAACQYSNGQSIFNRYAFQNVRCDVEYQHGSALKGLVNLYANNQYNKTEVSLVGSSDSLFLTVEGSSVTTTYDLDSYLESDWESNIYRDVGKMTVTIRGGGSLGSFSVTAEGRTMDTSEVVMSIPYNIDITFEDGSYVLDKRFRVLPGSVMTVGADATLEVTGELHIVDGMHDHVFRDKYYPRTETLQAGGMSALGRIVVNGTLVLGDGCTFTGLVEAGKVGATVKVSEKVSVLEGDFDYGVDDVFRAGFKSSTIDDLVVRHLSARVDGPDVEENLVPGGVYTATDVSGHVFASFDYRDEIEGRSGTITVDEQVYGTWSHDLPLIEVNVTHTSGGTTSPSGKVFVEKGSDLTITVVPNDGFRISEMKVGGEKVRPGSSVVLKAVGSDTTVEIAFQKVIGITSGSLSSADATDLVSQYNEYIGTSPDTGAAIIVTSTGESVDLGAGCLKAMSESRIPFTFVFGTTTLTYNGGGDVADGATRLSVTSPGNGAKLPSGDADVLADLQIAIPAGTPFTVTAQVDTVDGELRGFTSNGETDVSYDPVLGTVSAITDSPGPLVFAICHEKGGSILPIVIVLIAIIAVIAVVILWKTNLIKLNNKIRP